MAASAPALLIDQAMEQYGGCDNNYTDLEEPTNNIRLAKDLENPIGIDDFVKGVLRPATNVKRTRLLFDVNKDVAETALQTTADLIKNGTYGALPRGIRPAAELPSDTKMGYVATNKEDGTMDVMKVFYFRAKNAAAVDNVMALVTGTPYVTHFREGPWALKKAVQSLLDRIPGIHVDWCSVTPIPQLQRKPSQKWSVPKEQRRAGVEYVNMWCPEENDQNQQWLWIQDQIEMDSGSPIAGWPEAKVQVLASNKTKAANAAALVYRRFPLNVYDLHPVWLVLLPMIFPLLPEYGLLFLGVPDVGKTPTFIIIAMAMGRFWCRTRPDEVTGPPGWRRGKCFDNFNKRAQHLQEAVFLDDPNLDEISIADAKAFFEASEDRTVHARYWPAKLKKNAMVGSAQNEFDEEDEPSADERTVVTEEEGLKLVRKPFTGYKKTHVNAVLKRTITVVIGKKAAYLRFPGAQDGQMVHRIDVDGFHRDWLRAENKKYYGLYKKNIFREYEDFDACVGNEQKMIDDAVSAMGTKSPDVWVQECNEKLQEYLRDVHVRVTMRVLPPSPDNSQDLVVAPTAAGDYVFPGHPRVSPGTCDRRRRFVLPGDRHTRLRCKTTSDSLYRRPCSDTDDGPPGAPSSSSNPMPTPGGKLPADADIDDGSDDSFGNRFDLDAA